MFSCLTNNEFLMLHSTTRTKSGHKFAYDVWLLFSFLHTHVIYINLSVLSTHNHSIPQGAMGVKGQVV